MYQSICQAKPVKFIVKLYTDNNNLRLKHITHQKAEPLKAASFSKLDNTASNSFFNTKYSEFSTKW